MSYRVKIAGRVNITPPILWQKTHKYEDSPVYGLETVVLRPRENEYFLSAFVEADHGRNHSVLPELVAFMSKYPTHFLEGMLQESGEENEDVSRLYFFVADGKQQIREHTIVWSWPPYPEGFTPLEGRDED